MCAIYGIIGQNNIELLKKMSASQIFRGPDSQEFYDHKETNVSFGINRLAVIDRELGIQPMLSWNKKFILVLMVCCILISCGKKGDPKYKESSIKIDTKLFLINKA